MKPRYLFTLNNYRFALIAAFFFGCISPGSRLLIENLPPQSMAGIMYLAAGIGLFAILLFRRTLTRSLSTVQKADFKWFFIATLFGGLLGPAFFTYGIFRISSATASLLLNLEAVLTSLIAWTVFKEHFEKNIVYGMILIVAGCLILTLNSLGTAGHDTFLGFALICFACLSWAIDNNVTNNISHLDPVLIASFKGLIAGSTNLFLGFIIGEKLVWNSEILQAGLLGFFGIGLSLVAFIISLATIGTARTGAIFSTAPFIGLLISIVFLGEAFTLPIFLALVLMIAGVSFHFSENHGHKHEHNELSHSHKHTHDDHHKHIHPPHVLVSEGHVHTHAHEKLIHKHPHFPDIHHQHDHDDIKETIERDQPVGSYHQSQP